MQQFINILCVHVILLAVLNCTRLLIRILPYLFEAPDWRLLFWSPANFAEVSCVFVIIMALYPARPNVSLGFVWVFLSSGIPTNWTLSWGGGGGGGDRVKCSV